MGSETILVRCNLSQAAAPVEVDYCNEGPSEYGLIWESTQYQCADARHTYSGLVKIAKAIAAQAMETSEEDFSCDAEEIE